MSASNAFGSKIVRGGVEYPRLRTKEYGELESACRAKRRAILQSLLSDAGVTAPQEKFVAMKDALSSDVGFGDVDDYLGTYDGAKRAFKLSLSQDGKTEEQVNEVFGKFGVIDAIRLARDLVGWTVEGQPDPLSGTSEAGTKPLQPSDADTLASTPAN
jgi:hypothetical protein